MSTLSFELLRFEATPVTAEAAIVELEGSFPATSPARPRLLVETGGVARELDSLAAGGEPWAASFAVPLASLVDDGARFALVPGRGPLVELPLPTVAEGEADRFVALARTVNELRRRVGDAETARDKLTSELDETRSTLARAEERVAESHDAAVAAREEQARAEGEADEAREAHARAREASSAELATLQSGLEAAQTQVTEANDRAVAAEAEARAAQADLSFAQERVESLMREARMAAAEAADDSASESAPLDDSGDPRTDRSGGRRASGGDEGAGSDAEAVGAPGRIRASRSGDTADIQAARLGPEWANGSEDQTVALSDDAGDPATTARLTPVEGSRPGLWSDDEDSVRVLRPRTSAGRRRPAPVVEEEDDDDDEDGGEDLVPSPPDVSPARRAVTTLTSPRVVVGGIFLLLLVALVLIFSGIGPVGP